MGKLDKETYERKRLWAEKRAEGNRNKCSALTEEQHNVLEWLCSVRHEMHCSIESIWCGDTETLNPFDNSCGPSAVVERIKEVGLPDFGYDLDLDSLPFADDFFNVLDEDERDEWEQKAEELNEDESGFVHSGASLWKEDSGEYDVFYSAMEGLNSAVEEYLRMVDKQYGTDYAPSGHARQL